MTVIAEEVHRRLARDIGWEPYLRTDIVLVDSMDLSNGFAQPFPYNRVQIYVSRPEPDGVLNNYDDWLTLVFTHEYTHILNLDTIGGLPAMSRYTVGRCCFPNMFLPIWQIEGNAVYHESRDSRYGRNNSTWTDMILRSEIASGGFPEIDVASHYPRKWPGGSVPYLYGGLFIEHLEAHYGRDSFSRVMQENSDNILPYFVNYNANQVYRKDFPGLWLEWKKSVSLKYKKQIDSIKNANITEFMSVTKSGYRTMFPRFHPDGNSLFWVKSTPYGAPTLMKYSFETKVAKNLCQVHYPGSLSIAGDGSAYLSDLELYRNHSQYYDIFSYSGSYKRRTWRRRALQVDVGADGKSLIYVKQERDSYWLMLEDIVSGKARPIIEGTDIQVAHPRISPDSTRIAFTYKDRDGKSNIAIHNIGDKTTLKIFTCNENLLHPSWYPDGKRLVFSSDRTGVYNLYEWHEGRNTVRRLTNLIGGAVSPDVSPSGRTIAFSNYGAGGFDIALIDYPASGAEEPVHAVLPLPGEYFTPTPRETTRELSARSYRPWFSVLPSFWIPVYFTEKAYEGKTDNAFGFTTMGSDTLYQYQYSLLAYVYAFQERAAVDATLMISPFYPDVLAAYRDDTLFWGDDLFPWEGENSTETRRKLKRNLALGIAVPFLRFITRDVFILAWERETARTDIFLPGHPVATHHDSLGYARLALYHDSTREYPFSISKEDGRSLFIIHDNYRENLGSDYAFHKTRGEYSEFVSGPWRNNIILLRLRGGISVGAPDHLAPYSLGRYEKGRSGGVPQDEDSFGMRGYPAGGLYGTRLAVAATEYRVPLLQADVGHNTYPLMFRDLWGALFFEYGNVWSGSNASGGFRSSAGVELHMRTTLGYYLDITGYIGAARGFGPMGESQVFFGVATVIEGALKNHNKWFDFL